MLALLGLVASGTAGAGVAGSGFDSGAGAGSGAGSGFGWPGGDQLPVAPGGQKRCSPL